MDVLTSSKHVHLDDTFFNSSFIQSFIALSLDEKYIDWRFRLHKQSSLLSLGLSNNNLSIINTSNPIQSNPKYNKEKIGLDEVETYREIIKENIDYEILAINLKHDISMLDEIVDLLTETVCTAKDYLTIAGDEYPAALVKSKFLKLDAGHIEYVIDCMKKNTTDVRNIKKYLLAVLFNAPSTMDSYYTTQVNHDMYGGWYEKIYL